MYKFIFFFNLIQTARNQIELIFEILGSPTNEEIEIIPTEKSKKLVKSLPKRKGKNLETLFPNANPDGKRGKKILKNFPY